MKRLAKWFLGSVMGLVVVFGFVVLTATGTRWTLTIVTRLVPGLDIQAPSGPLLGAFSAAKVAYQGPGFLLQLDRPQWQRLGLCGGSACLVGLQADHVVVNTTSTEADAAQPLVSQQTAPAPIAITFPLFDVILQNMAVGRLDVAWTGGQLTITKLNSSLSASAKQIHVASLSADHVGITITPDDDNEPSRGAAPDANRPLVLPTLDFVVPIALDRLRVNTLSVPATPLIEDIDVALTAQAQRVNITTLAGQMRYQEQTQKLSANGAIALSGNYPLQLELVVDGQVQQQPLAINASVKGDLRHLNWTLRATKPYPLQVDGDVTPLANLFTATMTARSTQPFELSGALSAVSLSKLLMDVRINGTRVDTNASVCGEYQYPQLSGCAKVALTLAEQQITLHPLTLSTNLGQVSAKGHWALEQNKGQFEVQGEQLALTPLGIKLAQGQLTTRLTVAAQKGWQLEMQQLTAKAQLYGRALQAQAKQLSVDDSLTIMLQQASVRAGDNSLELHSDQQHPDVVLGRIAMPQLDQFYPELNGGIKGTFRFSAAQRTLALKLTGSHFGYQQYRLHNARVSGHTDLDLQDWQIQLQAGQLQIPEVADAPLVITAKGSRQNHQFDIHWGEDDQRKRSKRFLFSIAGNTRWVPTQSLAAIHLDRAKVHWQHLALVLNKPADLQWAKHRLALSEQCWSINRGQLCLHQADAQSSINATLDKLPLRLLNPWLPEGRLTGQVAATMQIDWPEQGEPKARGQFIISAGHYFTQGMYEPFSWQRTTLDVGIADHRLSGALVLPLTAGGALNVKLNRLDRSELDAAIEVHHIEADNLRGWLGTNELKQGELDGRLQLSGAPLRPSIHGGLTLTHVTLAREQLPVEADSVSGSLQFSGAQAEANLVLAQGEKQWRADAHASWQQPVLLVDGSISGDALVVRSRQYGSVHIAPDLHWQQQGMAGQLTGKLTLPTAHLSIPETAASRISVSQDQVLLDRQQVQANNRPFKLSVDVNVELGDDVNLAGYGFDGRLVGQAHYVQSSAAEPELNGQINVRDGRFKAYGQDLLIRKGTVRFNGEPATPLLNVEAIRNPDKMAEDDVTVGVRITGTPDRLRTNLFSEPAMSDPRVFSYLISGHDVDEDSGQRYSAQAAASLGVGLISNFKYLSQLGSTLGIDNLQVDTSGVGDDTQMVISGYVSDDLKVSYGRGIFAEVSEFTVRYRLASDLYLEVVSGLHEAVDLFYSFTL